MKKILVANIFGIGDVLFTTPLIANLRKEITGVEVDYLCNARTRGVVECVPGVGRTFVYEKDDLARTWRESRKGALKAVYRLFSEIRRNRYDVVFDFTLSREFGLFFALAGIPGRIGLDYKKRGLFLTCKIPLEGFEKRHVIEHYLDLLKCVDLTPSVRDMRLVPDNEALEQMADHLREKNLEGKKLVAVIPGGGASWGGQSSRKRWDPQGFARAADILAGQDLAVMVLGDTSEKDLCRAVSGGMEREPVIVENDLTLKRYIALLGRCDLVLCNDGGPLHMAVALGVKTVSVFGPVDEKVYGPYPASEKHRVMTAGEVSCRPCYNRFKLPECTQDNRCLGDIDPEDVADACLELLGGK